VATNKDPARDLPAVLNFGRVPVNRHFGFSLLALGRAGAEVAVPLKHIFVQEKGGGHGGVLTILADTAAAYTVYPFLDDGGL